jgi:hypothetical protein
MRGSSRKDSKYSTHLPPSDLHESSYFRAVDTAAPRSLALRIIFKGCIFFTVLFYKKIIVFVNQQERVDVVLLFLQKMMKE